MSRIRVAFIISSLIPKNIFSRNQIAMSKIVQVLSIHILVKKQTPRHLMPLGIGLQTTRKSEFQASLCENH